jgi:hypothetical protein
MKPRTPYIRPPAEPLRGSPNVRFGPVGRRDLSPEKMADLAPEAIRVSARYRRLLSVERMAHDARELRELHGSYRAMAVANGVPADDPALAGCIGNLGEVRS